MSERLRIAQVAPLWYPVPPAGYGGVELVVHLLTEDLVRRGHAVTLFSTKDSRTAGMLEAVVDEPIHAAMVNGRAWTYEPYATAALVEALRRAREFDVVHVHLSAAWLPVGRLTSTPTLFTLHNALYRDDVWVLDRYADQPAVGISRSQVAPVRRHIPVVYNGIDFDAFEPGFERGEYLAFLGRLTPVKNPAGAIRVARAIDMPIVIAGPIQDEAYFRAEVEPLLDGERVRWIGPVDHPRKAALLRNAAALVFPITWPEPFGLVMIEAMASGTPVIGLRCGAVPEVVDAGITGYHADSEESLPALTRLALELDRRRVRVHAEHRFGHRRMVEAYLQIYRSGVGLASPVPASLHSL